MYIPHAHNTAIVFLDEYGRTPLVVTSETYAHIQELVQRNRACRTCGDCYDTENPRVSQNLCLLCYQAAYRGYRYLGAGQPEKNYEPHLFKDKDGKVFVSHNIDDDKPDESKELTLAHYGYPVPVMYDTQGKEIYTNTSIYGVLGCQFVVVRLKERGGPRGEERSWFFLCDRTGKAQGFTRRDTRYQTAKKQNPQATRKGSYDGESETLRIIARLANETKTVQIQGM